MKCRKEKDFISFFDETTGCYMRTGIIENGKDTGVYPFMTSFPELLDVGIMGHCIHGKTGLCLKSGVECYQNGLHSQNANMSVADFEEIARQCKDKTYQFALGGCGDPDLHESFEEILNICKAYDIVPNFTTSGLGMTPDIAKLCKKHCGAVAVSWYRSTYTLNAIKFLVEAGVKTNIHYVLTKDSIGETLCNLKERKFPDGINAVVFLLHKPVGLGTAEKMVTLDNPEFQKFIKFVSTEKLHYKIGFDSCTIPALINNLGGIDADSLDTCEGARWSAYITADMKMLPCSFDNQKQRWAVDLRTHTIKEAWDSDAFDDFRNHFKTACPSCNKRNICMGGCPITPEVVLCHLRKHVSNVV